jgi:uncharacterized protein (TIGR02246 family)
MAEKTSGPETSRSLARIMEMYRRAWETRDAEMVVGLFTEDATYQENPFGEPIAGRDAIRHYWEQATAYQRDIRFGWRPVSQAEDLHVVEWQAEFTRADAGKRIELRGMMLIELRGERICRFREYWLRRERANWTGDKPSETEDADSGG